MGSRKVKYSKFFPDSCSFVSVVGRVRGSDDYDVSLDIGDGNVKVNFFLSDFYKVEALAQLKAIQEGVRVAIEFYESSSKSPATKEKPAAKKPKKVASKKLVL
jgi:hypothetical protein